MIEVVRTFSKPFEEPPLSWKPVYSHDEGKIFPLFTCSNGHTGLLKEWEVTEEGIVSPSVDCTEDNCDFHDHIKLLGWESLND